MCRWPLPALALLAGGCDAVWGLKSVRSTGVDAAIDTPAAPSIVTGKHRMRYVSNDATFTHVVTDVPYPPGEIGLAAVLDDGTAVPVNYESDGTFSFERAYDDQPYRLVVTTETRIIEYQHTASHLELMAAWAGRRNTRPVAQSTLVVPFPDATTATSGLYLASTGLWTHTGTPVFGPSASYDWRLVSWLGHQGMLDASEHDRLYAFELGPFSVAGTAPTYTALKKVSSASVDLVSGGTVNVPGPTPVVHDACIHFSAPDAAEAARIQQVTGRTYPTPMLGDWLLYKVAAPTKTGVTGAIWIAIASQSTVVDLDLAPTFYDPFPGGELVISSAALGTFETTLPGTTLPFKQNDISRRFQLTSRAPLNNCGAAQALVPTIGLAGMAALDGVPLDADNKNITLDASRDVTLTWSVVAPGPVHTTTVSLFELVAVGGQATSVARRSVVSVGTSAVLDRSYLESGHTYIIALATTLSSSQAANGDFVTIEWPIESATMWTRSFRVQ